MSGKRQKRWTREEIFTIPNVISLFRLVLIPVIIYQYTVRASLTGTLIALALSGLSDILDGWIARRFHMVSDLGKILDPIADKLTQAALMICLLRRNPVMVWLFVLLAIKEIAQATLGLLVIRRKNRVNSSHWYGKACTVVIYVAMLLMIVWQEMPQELVIALVGLCAAALLLALVMYARLYTSQLREAQHGESPDPS